MKLNIDEPNDTKSTAGCAIDAEGYDELLQTLKIIQQISKYQQVLISKLDIGDVHTTEPIVDDTMKSLIEASVTGNFSHKCSEIIQSEDEGTTVQVLKEMLETKEIEDHEAFEFMTELIKCKYEVATEDLTMENNRLIIDTVKISKNIRYLNMTECLLSPSIYKHIVQQLHGCEKLEELDLHGAVGLPEEWGQCIAEMTSLTKLNMSRCFMTQSERCSITEGLSQCVKLKETTD